ncbi:MAG TPA: RDD family protein [Steroidobacteraceae bacterium]|nr:RDD family protein [Steroidobacteraceae bacterium]
MTMDVLDAAVMSETPEGILIELRPAGLAVRFYAYSLDFFIRFMLASVASAVLVPIMRGVGVGIVMILFFGMEWFYPVIFELTRWGATPGKRTFGLKTVMDNGLPITPAASIIRNLLRVADFIPAMFGFGILSMLLRRDFKRLGDIAASTLVVYEQKAAAKPRPLDITPVAPARPLAPEDQAALMAFAARASKLTGERQDELAAIAAPIAGCAAEPDAQVTRKVLGVAQWLLGRRV